MSTEPPNDDKAAKKRAKAEAKAAKKEAKAEAAAAEAANPSSADDHAERSLRASETKVRLERWRTVFAAIGALVAAGTLGVMLLRSCGG